MFFSIVFLIVLFLVSCSNDVSPPVKTKSKDVTLNTITPTKEVNGNSGLDGPGGPMRIYAGDINAANKHASSFNFDSVFLLQSDKNVSNLKYIAEVTIKYFYEEFDLLLDDTNYNAKLYSRNTIYLDNSKIEYDTLINAYDNLIITIFVGSKPCTTIEFSSDEEIIESNKLIEYVKNNIKMVSK